MVLGPKRNSNGAPAADRSRPRGPSAPKETKRGQRPVCPKSTGSEWIDDGEFGLPLLMPYNWDGKTIEDQIIIFGGRQRKEC